MPLARLRTHLANAARLVLAWLTRAGQRLSSDRVGIVLVYHSVGDAAAEPGRELVPTLSVSLFKAQLLHLRRRYRVVPACRLLAETKARRRGQRFPVAITFDDDLRSHLEVAAPILKRVGLPATFFLCGASLSEPAAFWWERLQIAADRGVDGLAELIVGEVDGPRTETIHELADTMEAMPIDRREAVSAALRDRVDVDPEDVGLRSEHVRALAEAGFDIGFHTRGHDALPPLDDDVLERALVDGRSDLASLAGAQLTMIAYPHGKADERVASAARAAGYSLGFTGPREAVKPPCDPLLIGRFEPSQVSVGHFALQLVRAVSDGQR